MDTPWWELLRRQLTRKPGLAAPPMVPAKPLLHLVANPDEGTDQQTMAAEQTRLDVSSLASEHDHRDKNAQAA